MLKLIIFDLDGTLVDAFGAVVDSFNFALASVGAPRRTAREIERCVGHGERRLIESLIPAGKVEQALGFYRDHHKTALVGQSKFLPGVEAFLTGLQEEGYDMALASNRPSYFTSIILDQLKMNDFFMRSLCADQVVCAKPAPDILEQLIAAFFLTQEDVLFVGDTTTDMEAGQRAGVKTVGVTTGPHTMEDLAPFSPYKIVDNIQGVKVLIDELSRS